MTELAASLVELAGRYGVATGYDDWAGNHRVVAESTLVAVLGALGVPAATEEQRLAGLVAHDRDYWLRHLPPSRRWGRDTQRVRAAALLLGRWHAK